LCRLQVLDVDRMGRPLGSNGASLLSRVHGELQPFLHDPVRYITGKVDALTRQNNLEMLRMGLQWGNVLLGSGGSGSLSVARQLQREQVRTVAHIHTGQVVVVGRGENGTAIADVAPSHPSPRMCLCGVSAGRGRHG